MSKHILCVKPSADNKYFINTTKGGYSGCQIKNATTGSTLPNCVGFASGWFNYEYAELTGYKGSKYRYFMFDAENFWWQAHNRYTELKTGQIPKEGAIACWSGGLGHVAIVNKVFEDGSIELAESISNGVEFQLTKVTNSNGRWGMNSAYTFQGFIYNPALETESDDLRQETTEEVIPIMNEGKELREIKIDAQDGREEKQEEVSWKAAFTNLLKVKSIMTLVLTGVAAWMAIKGEYSNFEDIYLMIIAFYFGTQVSKSKN